MDINRVFDNIRELGHNYSKREELREYCKLKIDEIIKFLPRRILVSDGADILECIFSGIPDNQTSTKHKVKIMNVTLKCLRKESTSLKHCSDVTSRMCLELSRLPLKDVVTWCNDSVQSIVDDSDVNMIWRDILPEALRVVSFSGNVQHCGTELSSEKFREQCIQTLCQCRWNERQLVQLAAMFNDIQLSRSEHKQIVIKMCLILIDVLPENLPPLLHQLLKLCKNHNIEVVLAYLAHYFNLRLYNKLEPPQQDSESTTVDIEEYVHHSQAEVNVCLSTCIFHVSQGATDPESIKKHLKQWPRSQLLRNPFIIDLALAISNMGTDFRAVSLEVIKSAIEHRAMDQLKYNESAWVRTVLPHDVVVVSLLKVLTTESSNHRQLTAMGLINLAFGLLSTSRQKLVAPTCWSHGKLILVRLAKYQPETAGHILSQLADKLAGELSAQRQYSDCLYVLCKLTPLSLERCSQLSNILENCQPLGTDYFSAAAVLGAVHPLLKFSTRIRDTLVMVCRKGLYSRDSSYRCLALSGLLSVLRHIKLPRGISNSQGQLSDQYSTHSYLTQITVDLHATQSGAPVTSRVHNETMCMEVISILRRCLVQDATVKQLLYSNIFDCAKDKPVLHEPVLELLYEHLTMYIAEGHNGIPILLDKCVQVTATSAILLEPIGLLLYAIAQFLQQSEEEDLEDILSSQSPETGSAYLKNKLMTLLNSLVRSFTDSQLSHFDMEGDPCLTDVTPESKAKNVKIQQVLQCFEALMAHLVIQWNTTSEDIASRLYKLYKSYSQLLEHTKPSPKVGKKNAKSPNDTTKVTQRTQKSQKSQKTQDKSKGPLKLSNMSKDRTGPFKALPSPWDLLFCLRILELLHSVEVPWSISEPRNLIRSKRDFHHFVLKSVQSVLSRENVDKHTFVANAVKIGAILHSRCIMRFQDMCDFDELTALACVDTFKECLVQLLSPKLALKIQQFLPEITGLSESDLSESVVSILKCVRNGLLQLEAETDSESELDAVSRKLSAALSQLAILLMERIPVEGGPTYNNVLSELEEYVRTCKRDCISLFAPLLTAGCRIYQDSPLLDGLITKLTEILQRIEDEDNSMEQESEIFPAIDKNNGHVILIAACGHISYRSKHTEHMLNRAKDAYLASRYVTQSNIQKVEKDHMELNKATVVQLCQLTTWTSRLMSLRCPIGAASDRILQLAVRLYSLLSAFIKHLTAAAGPEPEYIATLHSIRFERLLKLCGKKLSALMDNLITYLESSLPQEQGAGKILKDTKHIPRLVLEAEQFSKNVIILSTKTKMDLQQYLSLGTARDFRIQAPVLEEVLNAMGQAQDYDEDNIYNADTSVLSSDACDNIDNEDKTREEPSKKKRRLS